MPERDQQAVGGGDPHTPPVAAGALVALVLRLRVPAQQGEQLFMLFAPLEGWRRVEVPEQRARADWAGVVGGW